ncbi:MAG TPA: hypothetical protein VEF06_05720 [Bryobacteraceae bacterium]|nr:hypothetical protein [Bryobacteraceae bacterium]
MHLPFIQAWAEVVKRVWMDQETKDFLLALESRLEEKLGAKFDAKLSAFEERFDARLQELETRVRAHAEEVETRLLTEFWKWARTSEMKERRNSGNLASLDERLSSLEERVRDLEMRRPRP